ncbi:acetyl-CoA C-acetyltransferase [Algivirga pacifica]|uniref:Acetyl-CoA C-acetyltransferase n=1 Tax=Algivirga pacifica TaxID=1162670 RepID=A0ABP9D8N6_9BACT
MAYIYDAVRTPRGKGKKDGALFTLKASHLLSQTFKALERNSPLVPQYVEDAVVGCVTQVREQSGDIAKVGLMQAGYPDSVAGATVARFCGSGLEAVNIAAAYIMAGQMDLMIAGGVESMSRVPLGTDGSSLLYDPEMIMGHHIIPQGISADLIATKYGYSRSELDQYAFNSQQRATLAWEQNRFQPSVLPVEDINGEVLLEKDEIVRPSTTLEGLAALKPSFEKMGSLAGFDAMAIQRYPELEKVTHVHHAGNSSGIVDGAAVLLLGNRSIGEVLGMQPRARIRSTAIVGTEPTIMLTGPVPATQKALKKAGMEIGDIDLFEVNEAFAVVPYYFMDQLNVTPEKVNVNGGAIAMGHPLGATGALLVGTLLDELERRQLSTGLVTLCIGGGMGIATVIERC